MVLATQNLALSIIQAVGAPPQKEGKAWFLCMLSFSPPFLSEMVFALSSLPPPPDSESHGPPLSYI